jgi:hypothetical protein
MPVPNIMYKTLGFRWVYEAFCPASAFVTADRDEARNPQRFIHVSVGRKLRTQHNDRDFDNKSFKRNN